MRVVVLCATESFVNTSSWNGKRNDGGLVNDEARRKFTVRQLWVSREGSALHFFRLILDDTNQCQPVSGHVILTDGAWLDYQQLCFACSHILVTWRAPQWRSGSSHFRRWWFLPKKYMNLFISVFHAVCISIRSDVAARRASTSSSIRSCSADPAITCTTTNVSTTTILGPRTNDIFRNLSGY